MTADSNEQGTVRYIRCASCGGMNPASAATCVRCGEPQQSSAQPITPASSVLRAPSAPVIPQVICPNCHKSFPAGSKFCGYCGAHLPAAPPPVAVPPPPMNLPRPVCAPGGP